MTLVLISALAGGLGLAAWSQDSLAQPGQPTQSGSDLGRGRGGGHGRGLAEAAAQLGVTEAELKAALGLPAEPPPRPDLAAAATQLGVNETDLREALRTHMRNARERRGEERDPGAALAAAADQLGVDAAALRSALGLPETPPQRPDLASAAAQLGVSETELREALQSARGGMGCRQGESAPADQ